MGAFSKSSKVPRNQIFPKCLFRIRKAEPREVASGAVADQDTKPQLTGGFLPWREQTLCMQICGKGLGTHLLHLSIICHTFFQSVAMAAKRFHYLDSSNWNHLPSSVHGAQVDWNPGFFEDSPMHICELTKIWGCQVPPLKRTTLQLFAKVYLSRNSRRKRRSRHCCYNIWLFQKGANWRKLQKFQSYPLTSNPLSQTTEASHLPRSSWSGHL